VRALPVGNIVGYSAAVEEVVEPEAELLSRDLLEEKFSGLDSSQIVNIQALERLKGDLNSVIEDLEGFDSSMELSVSRSLLIPHLDVPAAVEGTAPVNNLAPCIGGQYQQKAQSPSNTLCAVFGTGE
jgi:hypothetical protein